MDYKNIPWWGHLLMALVAAAGLIWASYSFVPAELSRKEKKVVQLQDTLDTKEAEIRKGKRAVAKLDELERDIAALELKLVDLKRILPTEPELGDLLKWIKSLSDQANLELKLFNPLGIQEGELLKEQPIKMNVVGRFHQLGMFFDRVSKHARIINVEGVSVGQYRDTTARGATISASFTAKTFIFREESSDQGGAE